MSAPRGYLGIETTLGYSTDSGSTYTDVARISEIGEISFGEYDDVEVTGYDSDDKTREYIAGLADAGEIEVMMIWTADTTQQHVLGDTTVRPWKITLPDNPTTSTSIGEIKFNGYVRANTMNPQLDDRIEFSATIRISGKPTLTVPTS